MEKVGWGRSSFWRAHRPTKLGLGVYSNYGFCSTGGCMRLQGGRVLAHTPCNFAHLVPWGSLLPLPPCTLVFLALDIMSCTNSWGPVTLVKILESIET